MVLPSVRQVVQIWVCIKDAWIVRSRRVLITFFPLGPTLVTDY